MVVTFLAVCFIGSMPAQEKPAVQPKTVAAASAAPANSSPVPNPALYRLGAGDEIRVQQQNAEELDGKVARIDDAGYATFPLVGRLHFSGLTTDEAQKIVAERLSTLLLKPEPIVSISEYRSQPVSVVGAVNNPGVFQLQGRKTLLEVISLAGGLRQDAGAQISITRRVVNGPIPLKTERRDLSGDFSTATVDLPKLVNGRDPSDNISVSPNDVISVPRAEMIYVTGKVNKPGAFPLNENSNITVLQAISLAEGLGPAAAPKNAKVFRPKGDGNEKEEIPVNVTAIMNGKTVDGKNPDFTLQPRDILFIPDSLSKKAGVRAAEAAVQAVTGMLIWGRL